MLALDLDGTLLTPRGEVTDACHAAVAQCRAAGIRVVVCTGRGLAECRHILERIGQVDPVVVAGGSIIADPQTGRTLHRFAVGRDLTARAVGRLLANDHPALVLKDPAETGYDYLVVDGPRRLPIDPVTAWWFSSMNVGVRYVRSLDDDQHPEHTVRVGACGRAAILGSLRQELLDAAEGKALVHHFPAVVAPDSARSIDEGDVLHILELFDQTANKWSGVSHLAAQWGFEPSHIAAIGDEINDLAMLEGAGIGIAMGNAVPAVRKVARFHTSSNREDGVARAIEHLLAGRWI